jgi:hypothetical protein
MISLNSLPFKSGSLPVGREMGQPEFMIASVVHRNKLWLGSPKKCLFLCGRLKMFQLGPVSCRLGGNVLMF